jgi:hypothetical protein
VVYLDKEATKCLGPELSIKGYAIPYSNEWTEEKLKEIIK